MNLPASVAVLNEPMTMSLVPRSKHHAIELESSVVSLLLMINGIFPQVNETADAHAALAATKEVTTCEAANDLKPTAGVEVHWKFKVMGARFPFRVWRRRSSGLRTVINPVNPSVIQLVTAHYATDFLAMMCCCLAPPDEEPLHQIRSWWNHTS